MNASRDLQLSFRCPKTFGDLQGTGSTRFCSECCKTVTDVSELPEAEALKFLSEAPPKTCIRFRTNQLGEVRFKSDISNPLLAKMRPLVATALASLLPGSTLVANEPTVPEDDHDRDYTEEGECDFLGELSPFSVKIPTPQKSKQSFHQRKNYQNNQAPKIGSAD